MLEAVLDCCTAHYYLEYLLFCYYPEFIFNCARINNSKEKINNNCRQCGKINEWQSNNNNSSSKNLINAHHFGTSAESMHACMCFLLLLLAIASTQTAALTTTTSYITSKIGCATNMSYLSGCDMMSLVGCEAVFGQIFPECFPPVCGQA